MFDFDFRRLERKLAAEADDVPNAFVGIKGNAFYVPLGVPLVDGGEAENHELFLLLYRVLRKYTQRLRKYGKETDQSADDRDGAGRGRTTRTFKIATESGEKEVVYTRLQGVDDVLDVYDDLALFALRSRLRRFEGVDYSRIDRHLDRAVFLPDNTIYLDAMTTPKEGMERFDTDLVQLYCFLYDDIRQALGERDKVRPEVRAEAEKLRERHLWPAATLFGPAWQETLAALRGIFERIEQFTAYRDDAYWRYHDAVRQTLYPNMRKKDGIHWGINNFCYVWEDMGHHLLRKVDPNGILYADCMDWSPEHGTFSSVIDLQPRLQIRMNPEEPVSEKDNRVVQKSVQLRPDALVLERAFYLLLRCFREPAELPDFEWGPDGWDDYGIQFSYSLRYNLTADDADRDQHTIRAVTKRAINEASKKSDPETALRVLNGARAETENALQEKRYDDVILNFHNSEEKPKADNFDTWWRSMEVRFALGDMSTFTDVVNQGNNLGLPEVLFEITNDYGSRASKSFFRPFFHKESEGSEESGFRESYADFHLAVLDFKYKSEITEDDFHKQLVYELAFLKWRKFGRLNLLIVPGNQDKSTFNEAWGIWVVQLDFIQVAEQYA